MRSFLSRGQVGRQQCSLGKLVKCTWFKAQGLSGIVDKDAIRILLGLRDTSQGDLQGGSRVPRPFPESLWGAILCAISPPSAQVKHIKNMPLNAHTSCRGLLRTGNEHVAWHSLGPTCQDLGTAAQSRDKCL